MKQTIKLLSATLAIGLASTSFAAPMPGPAPGTEVIKTTQITIITTNPRDSIQRLVRTLHLSPQQKRTIFHIIQAQHDKNESLRLAIQDNNRMMHQRNGDIFDPRVERLYHQQEKFKQQLQQSQRELRQHIMAELTPKQRHQLARFVFA